MKIQTLKIQEQNSNIKHGRSKDKDQKYQKSEKTQTFQKSENQE